jgi:hypothetical protein
MNNCCLKESSTNKIIVTIDLYEISLSKVHYKILIYYYKVLILLYLIL